MSILYESYTESITTSSFCWGVHWKGQTFTPQISHKISSVSLFLDRVGNPGNVTVSIRATSSGVPIGSDLTVGTILEANIPASWDWIEVTLTPYVLEAGVMYAICWRAPDGDSDANSAKTGFDGNALYTVKGTFIDSDDGAGATWFDYGEDFDAPFKEYGTGITFPSDAITRVTNLIHRYNRKEGVYTMELALGEVTSDFGLPEWLSKPRASTPETAERLGAEKIAKSTAVKKSVQAAIDEVLTVEQARAAYAETIQVLQAAEPAVTSFRDLAQRTGLTGQQIAKLGQEIADIRMRRTDLSIQESYTRLAEISKILNRGQ